MVVFARAWKQKYQIQRSSAFFSGQTSRWSDWVLVNATSPRKLYFPLINVNGYALDPYSDFSI